MRRGLTLMLAAGALTAGCGGDDGRGSDLRGADAVTAPSVVLRAELAAAFGERSWLTAFATRTRLLDGPAAPTALAGRALDAGSGRLADRLGAALGSGLEARALEALRRQDRLWGDAAAAGALGDRAGRAAAGTGLDASRASLAGLLATDGLTRSALEEDLRPASRSLARAIDAVAAGRATAPEQVATAARRASRPAPAIAVAAERRRDPPLLGSAISPAADLTALAATSFTDAAYAQSAATALLAAGASPGPRVRAATRATERTSGELGQLVASVHGEDAGERFGALWESQAIALADYAEAKAGADDGAARAALATLSRFAKETTALLDEVDADGDGRLMRRALDRHVEAATAAIRAQAAASPKVGQRLLDGAKAARAVGTVLVARAAEQYPGKFPA